MGWLNLHYRREQISTLFSERFKNISSNDGKGKNVFDNIITNLVIVPDNLISQIINSNLEVRTSVSIDPITGAAKEKALFTSEAIPRATVFYGEIRLMHRYLSDDLPDLKLVIDAIKDSSKYYETLGIGGMTTRGFGRLKIFFE
ncbi:RAMP superfamily CRISPR-associated protein [Thermoanaerobacter siderophilus]|uniref:RAMP superfamily CRISPR-associated protein n=1 Tax=Thermoanaerobacter siderophilus TaxID=106578 RepID=UPI000306196C|nr:RAMP superfamily CRISPR-associated protein [Thermoanaerobacter siderophilus]